MNSLRTRERELRQAKYFKETQPGHDALAYIDGMDNVYGLMLKIYCLYNTLQNSPVPV